MPTIIVADSQPVCILGLRTHFEKSVHFTLTEEVMSFSKLKTALASLAYDVIILDINVAEFHNLKDIHSIRELAPSSKIVVFTTKQSEYFETVLLKFGVDLFVEKNESLEYLESHMEALLHQQQHSHTYTPKVKILSTRELEVLKMLALGMKNKEIGTKLDLNEKTISTYKLRLLSKLEANNTLELVQKALLIGII